MKPILLLITISFLILQSLAQYPTHLNNHTINTSIFTFHDEDCSWAGPIPYDCKESLRMRMEVPPWQIAGGWHTYFFSNGSETNTYSDPTNLVNSNSANIEGHGPYFAIGPNANLPWKHAYHEIYSAHPLVHPSQGLINIGFCHSENKNFCRGGIPYLNSINPVGQVDCNLVPDWDKYYAIATAAWTPSNAGNNWGQQGYNNELGPIVWPSNGYVTADDRTACQGFSHPSSILTGDYFYIFLNDTGPRDYVPSEEGRGRGIKLVRVHKNNCLNPSSYEVYYKDPSGNVQWLPSLPPGFTKETMLNYVKVKGPKSTNILPDLIPDNSNCVRFSVAKVNGQNYFIGCEEYFADNVKGNDGISNHRVALRFSYDLMNWSPRIRIIEDVENYDSSELAYPIFLSADGWSNTEIDLNNFYVIGAHTINPNENFYNWFTRVRLYDNTPPAGSPIACNWYMKVGADASGATLGDVDVTGNKLTVEAIFNRTEDYSGATAGGDLVSKHCSDMDANYFLRPQGGGITTTDGYFQIDLPCDLERDVTYHVAMVYDGALLSIYRNGLLQASIPASGNLVTNDWQTTVGTEACSSNWGLPVHFRGYITEVRIWKEARTSAQLQQFYNQTIGQPINDPDLLAYYTFHSSGNQGAFPGGASVFGNANVNQTNTSCIQDNVGCFGFARKAGTDKKPSVPAATVSSGAPLVVYPNPASRSATLVYSSAIAGTITINVLDVTGKRTMVMKRPVILGSNRVNINLNSLDNGVYFLELFDGHKVVTKKLVISK